MTEDPALSVYNLVHSVPDSSVPSFDRSEVFHNAGERYDTRLQRLDSRDISVEDQVAHGGNSGLARRINVRCSGDEASSLERHRAYNLPDRAGILGSFKAGGFEYVLYYVGSFVFATHGRDVRFFGIVGTDGVWKSLKDFQMGFFRGYEE